MRDRALFQGRFQPVSVGHAATLAAILQSWQHVTIGVVYDSPRPAGVNPRFDEYLAKVETKSYSRGRNPFLSTEIQDMWQAHIERMRLMDRVNCILVKRLEYELDFASLFPATEVDLVWPELSDGDHETDVLRHNLYPTVLGRPIYYVKPVFKMHNSRIREHAQSGRMSWSDYIPAGSYDVFRSIDGATRMASASGGAKK